MNMKYVLNTEWYASRLTIPIMRRDKVWLPWKVYIVTYFNNRHPHITRRQTTFLVFWKVPLTNQQKKNLIDLQINSLNQPYQRSQKLLEDIVNINFSCVSSSSATTLENSKENLWRQAETKQSSVFLKGSSSMHFFLLQDPFDLVGNRQWPQLLQFPWRH